MPIPRIRPDVNQTVLPEKTVVDRPEITNAQTFFQNSAKPVASLPKHKSQVIKFILIGLAVRDDDRIKKQINIKTISFGYYSVVITYMARGAAAGKNK